MPIFRRITDILSANAHDLVERFEDAETMLRQAVREMEAAVEDTMNATARSIAGERMLTRQLELQRNRSQQAWDRARESVSSENHAAARRALESRERHEKLAAALDDRRAAAVAHNQRLRTQLDSLRARLEEARQTMHILIARDHTARAQRRVSQESLQMTEVSEAFARFDRMSEQIERQEAESQAYRELTGDWHAEANETSPDVEVQLAALKRELTGEIASGAVD